MSPSPLSLSSSLPWLQLSAGWPFGRLQQYAALRHPAHGGHGAHGAQTVTCLSQILSYTTENVTITCSFYSL